MWQGKKTAAGGRSGQEKGKKEKEALRDKGKKPESTEPVGSSEKTEKREEVVKRDHI